MEHAEIPLDWWWIGKTETGLRYSTLQNVNQLRTILADLTLDLYLMASQVEPFQELELTVPEINVMLEGFEAPFASLQAGQLAPLWHLRQRM